MVTAETAVLGTNNSLLLHMRILDTGAVLSIPAEFDVGLVGSKIEIFNLAVLGTNLSDPNLLIPLKDIGGDNPVALRANTLSFSDKGL